jgi:fermentation-respiration switch protein FrsA (DUF1100 family)
MNYQKITTNILKIGLILYVLILVMMYFFQEKIIFKPTTLPQNYTFSIEVPFQEIYLNGIENGKIHSLLLKSKSSKGLIVYYHGNRAGLERWSKIVTYFIKKGYDVLVMDYRGYGKSTGKRTEKILYNDAQLVYDYAKKLYPENKITVYGRSLGSGLATYVSSKNNPMQMILETPYHSFVDVVRSWFKFIPKFLMNYQMNSYQYIKNVRCKTTIFHGTEDKVVPLSSAQKLYEEAPQPKEFILIETAHHSNIGEFEEYHQKINKILP